MSHTLRLSFLILTLTALAGCAGASDSVSSPVVAAPGEANDAPPTAPVVAAPVQTPTQAPTTVPTPTLTRLTEPGCCTQPLWSADSTQVRFVDKPSSTSVVGYYAVGLEGGPPVLVSGRLGEFSPDGRYLAYPEAGETYIQDTGTGQSWLIDNGGRGVDFSPDSTRLVWTRTASSSGGFDVRPVEFNIAALDGTPIGEPLTLSGGRFSGWLDDDHLLVLGTVEPDGERGLYSLALEDSALVELARGERLRSAIASPGGGWVVYLVLFDEEEPANNGFWMVSTDGQTRYQIDPFGAIQWRDADHLLVVPQEKEADSHLLLEIDAPTGEVTRLTEPAATPFVIAGGDWQVSPDGNHVVFVSSTDKAIWLLSLP